MDGREDLLQPGIAPPDLVDGDGDGVRQLVPDVLERGLAHELGDTGLDVGVGLDVVRVQHRPLGQVPGEHPGQQVDLVAGHRRDGHDVGEVTQLRHRDQLLGHPLPRGEVGLGDDGDHRGAQLGELGRDEPVARADPLGGRHAEPDYVDLGQVLADDVVEPLPQQGARAVQPRRVDEHELPVLPGDDAAHGVPGGLRLVAGDDDLGADERVGQGRLAGVGTPHEATEAGPERHAAILAPGPDTPPRDDSIEA